ncbi:MAG: hypothetical protein ABI180_13885 [Microcoleus sp.]|jgi:hypothetical protein
MGHGAWGMGHGALVEAYFQLAIALATARNRVFDQICGFKPIFSRKNPVSGHPCVQD